jgi:alkanesulfonate monooxygenase SsuD/methylene tetrahydromethanopterin reductase-like flavin-dependent oxidoreductase (luciferase family)
MNIISNSTPAAIKAKIERYRATYQGSGAPKYGMTRYIVLADTAGEALDIARRAYRLWHQSFHMLWRKHNQMPTNVVYPPEIDDQIADGRAVAGSPDQVRDILRGQLAETGANYMVLRFAFGDLSLAESLRSLDLFSRHVMPALREAQHVAAE